MQDGHKRLRTGRGAQDPRGTSPPPCPPISPTPGGPRPVPRLPLAAARGRSRYKRGRRRRRRQRRSMAGREAAAPVPAPHEGAAPQRAPHLHLAELSASQFLDVWRHFDTDGNGYIEGKELENFFQELESARKGAGVDSWKDKLGDKMKEFMHKYDKNADGKIEMAELAQILPTEENFLLCFRQHVGSSAEFMEAWRRYDTDRSGYIEANELKGFLSDLLKKANRPYDEPKLQEYTQTIVGGSRSGGTPPAWPHRGWEGARSHRCPPGGALRRQGVTGGRLCPAAADVRHERGREAGALRDVPGMKLSSEEFNAIFAFYDKDGSGFIDEHELDALLKDLYEKNKKEMSIQQLTNYRRSIMSLSDGGRLYRKELEIVLCSEPPV
uniref:Calbindin 2 n=1 Tax=Cairina moschata TaxID=8855 RepID=A0A8C3CJW6_CAIMO